MELGKKILVNLSKKYGEQPEESDVEKLFERECYLILERIRTILADDNLDDKDCFDKIESLVCLFEEIGSNCGSRHDFG